MDRGSGKPEIVGGVKDMSLGECLPGPNESEALHHFFRAVAASPSPETLSMIAEPVPICAGAGKGSIVGGKKPDGDKVDPTPVPPTLKHHDRCPNPLHTCWMVSNATLCVTFSLFLSGLAGDFIFSR